MDCVREGIEKSKGGILKMKIIDLNVEGLSCTYK